MPSATNKMKVSVNQKKNRLYCSWSGNVSKSDLDSFFTEIRFTVNELKPEFAVINDLTQCSYSELAGIPTFQRIMQYLVDRGMKDIVRVVKDKSLIYSQISNLSRKKQGYIPVYVHSIDEADMFLDNQAQRSHIRLRMLAKEVQFKTAEAWVDGQLHDISLGGCAVTTTAEIPAKEQQLAVSFCLMDKKKQEQKFTCTGEVTRTFSNGFAVSFTDPEELDLTKLAECLAQTVIEDL